MVVAFSSCKKDVVIEESTSTVESEEPILKSTSIEDYAGDRVKTIVVGLLDLSHNNNFVSIVNNEVAAQFDGDDNVLFSTLDTEADLQGIDLAQEIDQSISSNESNLPNSTHAYASYSTITGTSSIQEILDGFTYSGIDFDVQLYIPFIDEVNTSDIPVIVFGHEEVENTLGYKLNNDGSISVVEVDEDYAKSHLTWVVSFNETGGGKVPTGGSPKAPGWSVQINRVMIDEDKESWIKGKAEVAYVAVVRDGSTCTDKSTSSDDCLVKVSDDNASRWMSHSSTQHIIASNITPYEALLAGDEVTIILYECDLYGANSHVVCTGTPDIQLTYYSQNSEYGVLNLNSSVLSNTSGSWSTFQHYWGTGSSAPGIELRTRYHQ